MKFTELKLEKNLMKGIEEAGFSTLMPVQEETFIYTLKGKDVTVQSQTGTGKTAAFLVTIFQHFLDKTIKKNKKALIIAPTRELAIQIEKDAKVLGRYLHFTIGSFYGGVGYKHQEELLKKDVEVIIGTPGRLLDFNSKGKLDFRNIGFLVIDEADRMFDMGFFPDITRILRNSVPCSERQTMLFSATLDVKTRSIAREFMNKPVKIEIMPEQVTVDTVSQRIYHVARKEKLNLMLGILKKELPKNALIFTNTKHAAAQVAKHLEYNGYKCLHLSGDLPQSKRLQVINNFKSGKLPFLVATDVAARGLHIEGLEMIFNYDLPGDCENYVHRIGRTARAGKSGKAISLACENYIYNLEAIESFLGTKIPIAYAEDDLYEESKSEGMTFDARSRGGGKGGKRRKKPSHPKSRSRTRPLTLSPSAKKKAEKEEKKKPTTQVKKKKSIKKKKSTAKPTDRKGHKGTLDERLEYYKKKYGDSFKVKPEPSTPDVKKAPKPKKSFFKKISRVFNRKNSR